jgi:hypothetical protein
MKKGANTNGDFVLDAMYKYGITLRPVLPSETNGDTYWLAKITGKDHGSFMKWNCSKKQGYTSIFQDFKGDTPQKAVNKAIEFIKVKPYLHYNPYKDKWENLGVLVPFKVGDKVSYNNDVYTVRHIIKENDTILYCIDRKNNDRWLSAKVTENQLTLSTTEVNV